MEAGQESSDDKVSGSVIHCKKEMLLKVLKKCLTHLPFHLGVFICCSRSSYLFNNRSDCEGIRFGDNFPNCHGSYFAGTCAP